MHDLVLDKFVCNSSESERDEIVEHHLHLYHMHQVFMTFCIQRYEWRNFKLGCFFLYMHVTFDPLKFTALPMKKVGIEKWGGGVRWICRMLKNI